VGWFEEGVCGGARTDPRIFRDYFETFRRDLTLVAEFPYTDKVFRDSYYNYHAAKYRAVGRDCMRVFLFEVELGLTSIPSGLPKARLQKHFLGYIVLRPLTERPFGRAMISPRALTDHGFLSCLSTSTCSFVGEKLKVSAFPHESQDGETHSCAETAVWSIFEYYGNQYAEHRPVLPSTVIAALQQGAFRRLLPSKGLSIFEIGRALQHLGHGTQIYAKDSLDPKQFLRYLHYLVESGIPVIAGLGGDGPNDGHAIVVTGHSDKEMALPEPVEAANGLNIYDTADFPHRLVTIDDNLAPYATIDPNCPGEFYDGDRQNCKLTHFVVPLHRHMLMDVVRASELIQRILSRSDLGVQKVSDESAVVKRVLLTGGRSFKQWLTTSPMIDPLYRNMILMTQLPRFVWICELSTPENYLAGWANGFMVLDATGDATLDSLLHYLFNGYILQVDHGGRDYWQKTETLRFRPYQNNLKGEWCQWGKE
jgi:hypothetical protein